MAPSPDNAGPLGDVKVLAKTDPARAESKYQQILSDGVGASEASSRNYEAALIGLGELYRDQRRPDDIAKLLETSRSAFSSFAKAKSAKLGM